MGNALGDTITFLLQTLLTLFTFAVLLRFVMQAVKADFYNPICQGIVRITDPVLKPLRKAVKPIGGMDTASLLLAGVLQIGLLYVLFGLALPPVMALAAASFRLLLLLLELYFWALIIMVILSWVAPGTHHPAANLIYQITEPVLMPIRRLLPPMGGLDFSVLLVFMLLYPLRQFIIPALAAEIGLPAALLL